MDPARRRSDPQSPAGCPRALVNTQAKTAFTRSTATTATTKLVPVSALPPTPPGSPKATARQSFTSDRTGPPGAEIECWDWQESDPEWETEPERGRTRHRHFESPDSDGSRGRAAFRRHHRRRRQDEWCPSGITPPPSPSWPSASASYTVLPPHEPRYPCPPPTPGCDVSATAFSLSVSPAGRSASGRQRQYDPSEPPIVELRDSMVWYMATSTALHVFNQLALLAARAAVGNGGLTASWGRGCLDASTIVCCETAILAAWGWDRIGRGTRRGSGQPQRTWRRRWAKLEGALGWVFAAVVGLSIVGVVLLVLSWVFRTPLWGPCACAVSV